MNIIRNFIKLIFGIPDTDPIPQFQLIIFFVLITVVVLLFITLG